MKSFMTTAISVLMLGAAIAPAWADTPTTSKGPPKTMGDEGKLPATGTVGGAVSDMRGTDAPSSASEALTDTGAKRMGDEGRLPATGAMSGSVPEMTAPSE